MYLSYSETFYIISRLNGSIFYRKWTRCHGNKVVKMHLRWEVIMPITRRYWSVSLRICCLFSFAKLSLDRTWNLALRCLPRRAVLGSLSSLGGLEVFWRQRRAASRLRGQVQVGAGEGAATESPHPLRTTAVGEARSPGARRWNRGAAEEAGRPPGAAGAAGAAESRRAGPGSRRPGPWPWGLSSGCCRRLKTAAREGAVAGWTWEAGAPSALLARGYEGLASCPSTEQAQRDISIGRWGLPPEGRGSLHSSGPETTGGSRASSSLR